MERGNPQYTLGLPLFTPYSNQQDFLLTYIWHKCHDPRWSQGTIDKETTIWAIIEWRKYEGKTRNNRRSPRHRKGKGKNHQSLSSKKIQYKGSTISLSTWWPRMASLRWSQKRSPSGKAWSQLGKPIHGHNKPRQRSIQTIRTGWQSNSKNMECHPPKVLL